MKYETHAHTTTISACSRLSPEQIVELYLLNGYDGLFITEHFMGNGCCKVPQNLSYSDKIDYYCQGYERVKEVANGKLKIFFGFEYSYEGTDVLVYGWDKNDLKKYPEISDMSFREFINFANSHGAITFQAHPFREAHYIDHIRLYPECEGVEVFNSSRNELCNKLGKYYAECYGKLMLGGSDIHIMDLPVLSGMEFDFEINSESEFISALRDKKGKIIEQKNLFIKE